MTATSPEFRYWIDMCLECVRRDHTPSISTGDQKGPFLTSRALGMALAALHDAAATAAGLAPILQIPGAPAINGENAVVAGAAACLTVLQLRYPRQIPLLLSAWSDWCELNNVAVGTAAEGAGRVYGRAIHSFGNNDANLAATETYKSTGKAYAHQRPAHEPMQHFSGSEWGKATPLLAPIVPGFALPPGRTDKDTVVPTTHYQADFEAVKLKGVAERHAGTRTLEEEIVGIFWGYDGPAELGTPPRLYLQIVLKILDDLEAADRTKTGPTEELRIVAAIAVAMADAAISAWHYKYAPTHMMWRPVVGIPDAPGDNGMPAPGWLPLGRPDTNGMGQYLTPDFPAYPSGHATFGAAAFQLLRLFLVEKKIARFDGEGIDSIEFAFMSDEFNGRNTDPRTGKPRLPITRGFASLWAAIVENSISRGFLGVHWFFDGVTEQNAGVDRYGFPKAPSSLGHIGGVYLGAKIANTIAPTIGITAATVAASKMAV